MRSFRGITFYCFSPPVMLATFVIETILGLYVLMRYKLSPLVRVASATLFCLALFQLAEYNVCGRSGITAADWSRIGFIGITLLPPLGIHLAHIIAGKRNRPLLLAAYGTALAWSVIFGLTDWAFSGYACGGNYAMFHMRQPMNIWYGAYYYTWLAITIGSCLHLASSAKAKVKRGLYALAAGYLVFLVPTLVINTLKPETKGGIPSIMCGFAVIFAFVLALRITPLLAKRKSA